MTGPVILGYDYGLLLELVAMGYVENALQKANPYKKNLQIWKETGLTFIDPITPATQSLPCNENFYVELSEISKKPGSSNVAAVADRLGLRQTRTQLLFTCLCCERRLAHVDSLPMGFLCLSLPDTAIFSHSSHFKTHK